MLKLLNGLGDSLLVGLHLSSMRDLVSMQSSVRRQVALEWAGSKGVKEKKNRAKDCCALEIRQFIIGKYFFTFTLFGYNPVKRHPISCSTIAPIPSTSTQ
ncbi:Hypothetical predicted protein [Cloeon dipterum]|uniref:Uncharacterized protein n=1 Tax=Cloeon dipterum TaxID=197152 RepID=A0A8S1DJ34_9INSE|nr:Hypothetical predicted protein [Cloeon dipterum]